MSDISINYGLTGKSQFYALLNNIATENLTEEDITLSNPKAGAEGRNTSIDVSVNRYVYKNPLTMYYDRVAVPAVFANQDVISVRELDINTDGDTGHPIIDTVFFDQFEAKYAFTVHAEDFTTSNIDEWTFKVKAKNNNLAYTGEISVVIEKALTTRVAKTNLDGFQDDQLILVP